MAKKTYQDVGKLTVALGALENDIIKAVADSIVENINLMESSVKASAPKAGEAIPTVATMTSGGQINKYNIGNYTYKRFANKNTTAEFGISGEAVDMAAYIEFGTGRDAAGYVPTLPDDFQKQALQFYKNGKGTIIRQPFFLPAWWRTRDKILKDAQANLDKIQV